MYPSGTQHYWKGHINPLRCMAFINRCVSLSLCTMLPVACEVTYVLFIGVCGELPALPLSGRCKIGVEFVTLSPQNRYRMGIRRCWMGVTHYVSSPSAVLPHLSHVSLDVHHRSFAYVRQMGVT